MTTLIGSPPLIAAEGSVLLPLLVIGAYFLATVLYEKWKEKQAELRHRRALQDSLRESPEGGAAASARPPAAKPQRSTQSDLESFLDALRGDKPPREQPAEPSASEPDASVTSFQDRDQRAAQRRRETLEREQPDARRRRERREALEQRQQKHQATLAKQAEREREQVEQRRREGEKYSLLVPAPAPAPAPAPEERDRPRPLVADAPTTQRLAAPRAETSLTAQAYQGKLAEILDVGATVKQITDGIRPDELARAIMMAEILGPPLARRPRSPNFRARRIV